MTGRASRDRGARAERAVVNFLRDRGFAGARRHHGADGLAPGDIMGVPGVCIEVKDVAANRWGEWRAQLLAECPPGHVAVLVRRVRGVTDVGMWDAEMWIRDYWWIGGVVSRHASGPQCPRTGRTWVRVPFRTITDLLKEETDG